MKIPTLEQFLGLGSDVQAANVHERLKEAVAAIQAMSRPYVQNKSIVGLGSGTGYTLTTTPAALDLNSTDPAIVLDAAGTYLLLAGVQLDAAGMTITNQTAALKLRRTNNTAADITGAALAIDLPVMTTLTHTLGTFRLPVVAYTTTATDDAVTIFGSISGALGAGTLVANAADITAVRLY